MGAGAEWKARREERGLTLEQAAAELRISQRFLRGIEEGNFEGWPARVFSSGYIRAYAKLLGMDPEPVLSEYYGAIGSVGAPEHLQPVRPAWIERERRRGSRRVSYTIAAAVVLCIGIILAYLSIRTAPKPPSAPAVKPPAAAPVVPAGPADNAAPAAGMGTTPGDNAATAPAPVSEQNAGMPPGAAGPVKAPLQLFIEASEMTWMMYGRDDAEPVDVMLYPGDRLNIQAQRKISLKLGNAGGVVGTLNGKPLPPFGSRGQVKEIRLGQ